GSAQRGGGPERDRTRPGHPHLVAADPRPAQAARRPGRGHTRAWRGVAGPRHGPGEGHWRPGRGPRGGPQGYRRPGQAAREATYQAENPQEVKACPKPFPDPTLGRWPWRRVPTWAAL